MDDITKYRIEKHLELYGDKVTDAFAKEFSMTTLKKNPSVALDMLKYLDRRVLEINMEYVNLIENYKPVENDLIEQKINLCKFSNSFKINKIRNIAAIYKYIWESISSVVDENGKIYEEQDANELPFD